MDSFTERKESEFSRCQLLKCNSQVLAITANPSSNDFVEWVSQHTEIVAVAWREEIASDSDHLFRAQAKSAAQYMRGSC